MRENKAIVIVRSVIQANIAIFYALVARMETVRRKASSQLREKDKILSSVEKKENSTDVVNRGQTSLSNVQELD